MSFGNSGRDYDSTLRVTGMRPASSIAGVLTAIRAVVVDVGPLQGSRRR